MSDQKFEFIDPLRLSKSKIILMAEDISRWYEQLHSDIPKALLTINFDHVYDTLLYPRFGISLEEGDDLSQKDGKSVFGYYDVFTNTVALDAVVCDLSNPLSSKKAFTFWHEVGHAFLHSEWLKTQLASFPEGRVITTESAISPNTSNKLEQQANLFAAHAAAPTWFLDFVIKSTFRLDNPIVYRGPGIYQLDIIGCRKQCEISSFNELCRNIAYNIRHRFGVLSIQSLSYRVAESKWVGNAHTNEAPSIRLLRSASVQAAEAVTAAF